MEYEGLQWDVQASKMFLVWWDTLDNGTPKDGMEAQIVEGEEKRAHMDFLFSTWFKAKAEAS